MMNSSNLPIKYAVFSGGGAKGAAYPGAYSALSETGVFKNVEAVAGSSAGAMTAAFVATGINPEEFKKLAAETNLKSLLGSEGISWPIPLGKDAKPMYELLKHTISKNIDDFFKNNEDFRKGDFDSFYNKRTEGLIVKQADLQEKIDALKNSRNEENQNKLSLLKHDLKELHRQGEKLDEIAKDPSIIRDIREKAKSGNRKITFKDLGYLRALDPDKFKDLLVTAVNKKTGKLEIFSPEQTPDVEIAIATKASASIPLVFQSTEIKGKKYVDGGYRDNVPLEYFKENFELGMQTLDDAKSANNNKAEGRVLTFAFATDDNNKATSAIYSGTKIPPEYKGIEEFLIDVVYKFIAGIGGSFAASKDAMNNYKELRENATNVVVLNTKDVGTLSFDAATKSSTYMQNKAELETLNYINNWNLNEKPIPNLDRRTFALELYEKLKKTDPSKSKDYLKYALNKTWEGQDPHQVINGLVVQTRKDKTEGVFINLLNKPSTPNSIKIDGLNALGIDNTKVSNLKNYKFSSNDLNTQSKPKIINNHSNNFDNALKSIKNNDDILSALKGIKVSEGKVSATTSYGGANTNRVVVPQRGVG